MTLDPYLVLGVSTNCEEVVIRAAYKALMLKYHPDTNKNYDATAHAASINEAFSVLGDPLRRAEYDAWRNDIIIASCFNRSENPYSSPQKTPSTTLDLAIRTLSKAAKAGWLTVGGSIIAALGVGAVMLTEIGDHNSAFFSEVLMSNAYAAGRDDIEAITPLNENIREVMCNVNLSNNFEFGTSCSQYNVGERFYGTLVFGSL